MNIFLLLVMVLLRLSGSCTVDGLIAVFFWFGALGRSYRFMILPLSLVVGADLFMAGFRYHHPLPATYLIVLGAYMLAWGVGRRAGQTTAAAILTSSALAFVGFFVLTNGAYWFENHLHNWESLIVYLQGVSRYFALNLVVTVVFSGLLYSVRKLRASSSYLLSDRRRLTTGERKI
jgi:hypothetical protein